jgi:hypothetical protein
MKSVLVVPDSPARRTARIRPRSRLTWATKNSDGEYGMGVIVHHGRRLLDGYNFRILREILGARILTTDPAKVREVLGLPESEPGIEQVGHD